MMLRMDDNCLHQLSIEPRTGMGRFASVKLGGPPAVLIPMQLLHAFDDWHSLTWVAPLVRDRIGGGMNEHSFYYDTEIEEDEEPYEGVRLSNYMGEEVVVSLPAFERLMARFFRAVIEGTPKNRPQAMSDPFWPEFVRITEELEERVRVQQTNGVTKEET